MARGINPGAIPHLSKRIPPASVPSENVPLRFSFKLLDLDHPKFRTQRCRDGYLEHFLKRLRDVCSITVREFRCNRSPSLKSHRLDFSQTSEAFGFTNLNEQLKAEEAWQF